VQDHPRKPSPTSIRQHFHEELVYYTGEDDEEHTVASKYLIRLNEVSVLHLILSRSGAVTEDTAVGPSTNSSSPLVKPLANLQTALRQAIQSDDFSSLVKSVIDKVIKKAEEALDTKQKDECKWRRLLFNTILELYKTERTYYRACQSVIQNLPRFIEIIRKYFMPTRQDAGFVMALSYLGEKFSSVPMLFALKDPVKLAEDLEDTLGVVYTIVMGNEAEFGIMMRQTLSGLATTYSVLARKVNLADKQLQLPKNKDDLAALSQFLSQAAAAFQRASRYTGFLKEIADTTLEIATLNKALSLDTLDVSASVLLRTHTTPDTWAKATKAMHEQMLIRMDDYVAAIGRIEDPLKRYKKLTPIQPIKNVTRPHAPPVTNPALRSSPQLPPVSPPPTIDVTKTPRTPVAQLSLRSLQQLTPDSSPITTPPRTDPSPVTNPALSSLQQLTPASTPPITDVTRTHPLPVTQLSLRSLQQLTPIQPIKNVARPHTPPVTQLSLRSLHHTHTNWLATLTLWAYLGNDFNRCLFYGTALYMATIAVLTGLHIVPVLSFIALALGPGIAGTIITALFLSLCIASISIASSLFTESGRKIARNMALPIISHNKARLTAGATLGITVFLCLTLAFNVFGAGFGLPLLIVTALAFAAAGMAVSYVVSEVLFHLALPRVLKASGLATKFHHKQETSAHNYSFMVRSLKTVGDHTIGLSNYLAESENNGLFDTIFNGFVRNAVEIGSGMPCESFAEQFSAF